MTDTAVSLGDFVAILAFLLSAYATWRAHIFKKREEELLEIQKKHHLPIRPEIYSERNVSAGGR